MTTNDARTAAPAAIFPDELCDSLDEWGDPFLFDPDDYETVNYEIAAWFQFNGDEPDDDFDPELLMPAPTADYRLVVAVGSRAVYSRIDSPDDGHIVEPEAPDSWSGAAYCYTKSARAEVYELRREIGDLTAPEED